MSSYFDRVVTVACERLVQEAYNLISDSDLPMGCNDLSYPSPLAYVDPIEARSPQFVADYRSGDLRVLG